jgi:hypothetical protein
MSSQEYSLPPSLLYPFPFFKSLHEVQGSITPMLKPCHNFRFEFEHRHFVSIDTQKHGEGGSAASWMQMNRLSLRTNWSGMTAMKSPLYPIKKIVRWPIASCALALACRPYVSPKKKLRNNWLKSQDFGKMNDWLI